MPLIIGITGSIATGKTTACEIMKELGAVHCDADKLVHTLYEPGKPAFHRIISVFGEDILDQQGYIDRKILGGKVFGNADEMLKLTRAIGDIKVAVQNVVEHWNNTLEENAVALLEAVNLIEAEYAHWCDRTWLFASDEKTSLSRLIKRNQLTKHEASKRLDSQRKWEDRSSVSDLVIFNNSNYNNLKATVLSEFHKLTSLSQLGKLTPSLYSKMQFEKEITG